MARFLVLFSSLYANISDGLIMIHNVKQNVLHIFLYVGYLPD